MKIGFYLQTIDILEMVEHFILECTNGGHSVVVFVPSQVDTLAPVYVYENVQQVQNYILDYCVDAVYQYKQNQDTFVFRICKNWIHSTVPNVHGDKFALASKWIQMVNNINLPVVSFCIEPTDTVKPMDLGVPKSATVIGILGPLDLLCAQKALVEYLAGTPDAIIACYQTPKWAEHARIKYVPTGNKRAFVEACTIILYGSTLGESVWYPVYKPTIVYENAVNKEHLRNLGGPTYYDKTSCLELLKTSSVRGIMSTNIETNFEYFSRDVPSPGP